MSAKAEETSILIAGAGPAGLVAAATLGRYGVDVLVVDSRPGPSRIPRANSVSTASMELFRRWGLEGKIREGDVGVAPQALMVETLARAADGQVLEVGFPSPEQSAVVGPAAPAAAPQDHLEPILEEYAQSFPSVRINREVSVVGVEQGENRVLVRLADVRGQRERLVRADYLIGADGTRSTIRDVLGIGLTSSGSLGERLAVLMRGPLWDVVGRQTRYAIYLTQLEREPFFLPVGLPDRWVFGATWDFEAEPLAELSEERVKAMILEAAGIPALEVAIERLQHVTYEVALADRFSLGRTYLIGDAAHRVTPRGGTGMNTAIRDGHDLGWKLAWVLNGWAASGLLDTYEAERRPVAEHNAHRSSDPSGSLRSASDELGTDLGARIPHIWLPGNRSSLDLLGPGLTLFTNEEDPGPVPADGDGPPLSVRRLHPMASRALGVSPGMSLLVRPDGVPAGLWGATPLGSASVRGKEVAAA